MEEKLIRLKENLIFAKAEVIDHIQNDFDKNMRVTKEDLYAILKPIQKIFKDNKFTSHENSTNLHPDGPVPETASLYY